MSEAAKLSGLLHVQCCQVRIPAGEEKINSRVIVKVRLRKCA